MIRKTFITAFACVLMLGLSLVGAVPVMANGTTYYVATTGNDAADGSAGDPWLTIQHAVDTVAAGNTISVAAGTYNESVTVNESLTLLGAKSYVDPRAGAWTSDITTINAGEGNNGILITASDVTVNGFKITESGVDAEVFSETLPFESAIYAYNETTELAGLVINYNWIDNNYGSGIIVRYANGPVVEYNYISNNGAGVWAAAGIGGQELISGSFSYNEIFNSVSYGIYFGGAKAGAIPGGITGTLVSYNDLHNNEKYGLQLYGYYDPVSVSNSGVSLENNNFHDNGRCGIKITDFTDTIVKDNQFSNNGKGVAATSDKYKFGALVSAYYVATGTQFTGNSFSGNELGGIYILLELADADLSDIAVNYNNLIEGGTKSGITTATRGAFAFPFEIDATNNWWEHSSGPYHATLNPSGAGDAVSDNVDFCPWLLEPYDAGNSEASVTVDNYGQSSQAFTGTDTTVDATGTSGTGDITVQTYNYSVPPDADNALCVNAEGQRALKYIDVKIVNNTYTGDICITIFYTDAELAAAGISDEESLSLYYWDTDPDPDAWVEATPITRNTTENWVKGYIPADKFSGSPLCLGGEEEGTGQYEVGAAPTVTVTFMPADMNPQVEQTVTVNVSVPTGESRTLAELTDVTFKVWYDSDGGAPTEGEFDAATANTQTCAIISWDTSTFSIAPLGGGTTWSLGTCTAPTLTSASGDFTLVFTPGKVATETTGSALWQLAATAHSTYGTGFDADDESAAMNWYGEILFSATVNVDWGLVPAGLAFGEDTISEEAIGATITIISNGAYDLKAKSSATWEGISHTATLDPTGVCDTAQEFALKADDTGILASAVLLDTSGVGIATDGITDETGDIYSNAALWLKLADTFDADIYAGTITYIIANG